MSKFDPGIHVFTNRDLAGAHRRRADAAGANGHRAGRDCSGNAGTRRSRRHRFPRIAQHRARPEAQATTASIDSIVAEDIGKFPDSNLAESMQRIPGVTLSRGDGGEGRNISVRGLGPTFTRVRINGMEGCRADGLERHLRRRQQRPQLRLQRVPDGDLLRSSKVRKTPSADVEEGSLGATVDLHAPRPFDYRR